MSTRLHLFPALPQQPLPNPLFVMDRIPSDQGCFARDQLRRLVRQLFFPGWPRPVRHVAFVAIDQGTDTSSISLQIGQILSADIQANTCVIEASHHRAAAQVPEETQTRDDDPSRNRARQISSRLWLMPQQVFFAGRGSGISPVWLEARLNKLHSDFEFTLLNLPSVASDEAALLGHLSDGVVLVLEAHSTRRLKAQRSREMLQAANVKILGSILNGRRFPIPEGIYRRL